MPSVGIDPRTGRVVVGWARTVQSLRKLITTELRSRVQRRDLGSPVPSLIDMPQNSESVMDLYMAIVEAIEPRLVNGHQYGEPCFEITNIGMDLSSPGAPAISVAGYEYPDGHLGDFSRRRNRSEILENL